MFDVPPSTLGAVVALAWPDFLEVSGLVVLANRAADVPVWLEAHGHEPYVIERALNEVHLYDVVDDSYEPTQLPTLENAGRRLADAWRAALVSRFPSRRFTVEFSTEPEAYGPTVSFHQADGCPGCEGR